MVTPSKPPGGRLIASWARTTRCHGATELSDLSEQPTHTETEAVHSHPRHTGHGWFDLIAAVTALAISAISLYVGIEHADTTRQLVAANSWPILQAGLNYDAFLPSGDGVFSGPVIENGGVGPAKIESFVLIYDGKPQRSYGDFLRSCCGFDGSNPGWGARMMPRGLGEGLVAGTILRPGSTIDVLQVRAPTHGEMGFLDAFNKAMTKVSYRACYCSVFDQCWTSDLHTLHPTSVKTCPADASGDTQPSILQ